MDRAFAPENFGADSHFSISVNNDISGVQLKESVLPIANREGDYLVNLNPVEQPVPMTPNLQGGGMIGSGLLSIEDAQLMKEFLVSEAWPFVQKILGNPRVEGTLEVAGGLGEMFIGATMAVGGGVSVVGAVPGIVGGSIVVAHGADHTVKGFLELLTGKHRDTVTSIGLQESGASPEGSRIIDDLLGFGMGIAGTKLTQLSKTVVGETTTVAQVEVCPRDIGLGGLDKSDFKSHFDTKSFGKKVDTAIISSETALKDSAQFIGEFDFYNRGILMEDYAKTFAGYKYKTYVLKEDVIVYRAGNSHKALGEYYSFDNPISELQVRIDKAIRHKWPTGEISIIDTVYEVKIPQGTKIYVGDAAKQGELYFGGTEQIVIPEVWRVAGIEVLKSYPINK